jgi:3'-phosphoadenosine 5'-phosphosulfate sulfotransferase (PAPS reductase)/FAD synthetase
MSRWWIWCIESIRKRPLVLSGYRFLFPETFDVRDRIIARYGLKPAQVIQMKPLLTPEQQAAQHGDALWASQPDQCCELRKIEPLTRILGEYGGVDHWNQARSGSDASQCRIDRVG